MIEVERSIDFVLKMQSNPTERGKKTKSARDANLLRQNVAI
jgi:hypothetical protein